MLIINGFNYRNKLKEIHLHIEEGEIVGVLGPSGSGKSLLLNAARGFARGKGKSVQIKGQKIKNMRGKKRNMLISAIPSSSIENLSDTVYNFLILSRMPYKEFFKPFSDLDHQVTEKYINALGLEADTSLELGTLSSSTFKLVLLAWTFIREAPLLILDNPDTDLNPDQKMKLFETITRYTMDGNRSVLMTSNDINTITQCADRIIIINDGLICQEGTPDIITKDLIEKYYKCQVLISRNIYNGRPEVHLFPSS